MKGGKTMRFYNQQHRYYCGIDLHARKMYVCILDQQGKTKVHENTKTDSFKIATLIRGGNFPIAYPYPAEMRATRDLLRRRMYLSHRCSELVAHIQSTNTQYNLPSFDKKISRRSEER